jgi:hypothetical protein
MKKFHPIWLPEARHEAMTNLNLVKINTEKNTQKIFKEKISIHAWHDYMTAAQPFLRHFLTSVLTSWERARVVTMRASGRSTMTRSSTPRQATRRPDPGTTMPPKACSETTVYTELAFLPLFSVANGLTYQARGRQEHEESWTRQVAFRRARKSHRHRPNLAKVSICGSPLTK